MSRIQSVLVCRPSSSSDVIPLVSCHAHLDIPQASQDVMPPSELEICRLARQRIRTYFENHGKIELDRFILHYLVTVDHPSPVVLVCVAEPGMGVQAAQTFLQKLKGLVFSRSEVLQLIDRAEERGLQDILQTDILKHMMETNTQQTAGQDQRINQLRDQVNEVKTVMTQNVEAIIERGDRLDNLEQRTDDLSTASANFKMSAQRVQRKMCMLNAKWTMISVICTLIVLTIVILLILNACGVFDSKK